MGKFQRGSNADFSDRPGLRVSMGGAGKRLRAEMGLINRWIGR
jgi:hypothetical protein